MNFQHNGLILEGGGMRGVYTTGVLNLFLEQGIHFPYVIGVSMGACNAANYISLQPERNKRVNIDYVNDSRYLSYAKLLTRGELFQMQFIFRTIPEQLDPFDYKTFFENEAKCYTTVTDCVSGEPAYFEKNELGNAYMDILQASSSLPFIAKPVLYQDRYYMDGGISDSIPIRKSVADGNSKHVIVLTQVKGYRKKPEALAGFAGWKYPQFPGLCKALKKRHLVYNETLSYIEELEKQGRVYVIRPEKPPEAGRVERDKRVLEKTYALGYREALAQLDALKEFLQP